MKATFFEQKLQLMACVKAWSLNECRKEAVKESVSLSVRKEAAWVERLATGGTMSTSANSLSSTASGTLGGSAVEKAYNMLPNMLPNGQLLFSSSIFDLINNND